MYSVAQRTRSSLALVNSPVYKVGLLMCVSIYLSIYLSVYLSIPRCMRFSRHSQVLRSEHCTLEDAAAAMVDLLELEAHYDSWMDAACSPPGITPPSVRPSVLSHPCLSLSP